MLEREQQTYQTEAIASHLQNIQTYASDMPPGKMQHILSDVVALQRAYQDRLEELAVEQNRILSSILKEAQTTDQYFDIRTEVAAIRDGFSALQQSLEPTETDRWLSVLRELEQDALKLPPLLYPTVHKNLLELREVPEPDRFEACISRITSLTRGDFYQASFDAKLEKLQNLYCVCREQERQGEDVEEDMEYE